MNRKEQDRNKMSEALRDIVLEASEAELRDAFSDAGEDFDGLAARGRSVVERALANAGEGEADVQELHRSLGVLIQLLRRKRGLSVEELAAEARVDVFEIRGIEMDETFDASPRTIYQLEQYFKLSSRSLVVLSGAVEVENDVHKEAVRFAASAKGMSKLNQDEKKELNRFVKFLREHTDR